MQNNSAVSLSSCAGSAFKLWETKLFRQIALLGGLMLAILMSACIPTPLEDGPLPQGQAPDKASLAVDVSGLQGTLVLEVVIGGAFVYTINEDTTEFKLSGEEGPLSGYTVQIVQKPALQTCEFVGPTGLPNNRTRSIGSLLAAGVKVLEILCKTNVQVTAAATGTTAAETVELQMTGAAVSTQTLQLTGPTTGTFTNLVPDGASVNLAALNPPAGKICIVNSPIVITPANRNVPVTCGPASASVAGAVTNNGPDTRTIRVVNGTSQQDFLLASGASGNFTIDIPAGQAYNITASDITDPVPGAGLLDCTITTLTSGTMATPAVPVTGATISCTVPPPPII